MRDWEEPDNNNGGRKKKTLVNRMYEQMNALTPRRGYNLVRIDPWSIPDEDDALTLIGHFDTYQEAADAKKKYPTHNTTIYGPRNREVDIKGWQRAVALS
jgi:hypothetical protein